MDGKTSSNARCVVRHIYGTTRQEEYLLAIGIAGTSESPLALDGSAYSINAIETSSSPRITGMCLGAIRQAAGRTAADIGKRW